MLGDFYKNNDSDKIWWTDEYKKEPDGSYDVILDKYLFSFDKMKVYDLFHDYPYALSKEEREIFESENPSWKEFFEGKR